MTLLVAGLGLWIAAHLFGRLAPGARAGLAAGLGPAARGLVAAVILAGLVLMVAGYRGAATVALYAPPGWGIHLNNLLLLAAVALFGVGHSQGRLRGRLRHPMLTGTALWAFGHLLVRGDVASVVLFLGLGLWALAAILLIEARAPAAAPAAGPAPRGSLAGDLGLLAGAVALFLVIVTLHGWLGPWPLPGGRWW